jgi:hypothetical protein
MACRGRGRGHILRPALPDIQITSPQQVTPQAQFCEASFPGCPFQTGKGEKFWLPKRYQWYVLAQPLSGHNDWLWVIAVLYQVGSVSLETLVVNFLWASDTYPSSPVHWPRLPSLFRNHWPAPSLFPRSLLADAIPTMAGAISHPDSGGNDRGAARFPHHSRRMVPIFCQLHR